MKKHLLLLIVFCSIVVLCVHRKENAMLSHFDLTNDGVVDRRELRTVAYIDYKTPPEISDEILYRSDTDMDNVLDKSELRTAKMLIDANAQRMAEQWLNEHDTDKDGRISEAELLQGEYVEHRHSFAQIREHFREADINNDLFLDAFELINVRRLLRAIAVKDAAEIMKKYDSDGDHFLSLIESQILADEVFDLGPDLTTIVLERVDHQKAKKINELELVDFLSELRKEAAVVALDKLAVLDKNGNGMVTFDEITLRYGKHMKKSILKNIFSEVDVNKNANIDPIEFVSMQNLISAWNREITSSKSNEKKRRVITVTMPRSPQMEALIQERKTTDNDKIEAQHVRLMRQADISPKEMEKLGLNVDSKKPHLMHDHKAVAMQITRSQTNGFPLGDKDNMSATTTSDPSQTVHITKTIGTNAAATDATTTTTISTTIKPTLVPTTISSETQTIQIATLKTAISENPPTDGNDNHITYAEDRSDSEDASPTDNATELDENGKQIRSELTDNDFSILTVKDTEGKVISNQAIADLKKFERFITRMREDIHRIVQMETAKAISKKKIAHDEVKTLHHTQIEHEKAALTKGQSKGTAASLGMSRHETEQPGFEIDSKQLNSTNDDKTVSTKAPISQPDDTRLRDAAQFERTTTTILSTVTVPITTRDSTTAAPTTTATTSTTVSTTTITTTTATSVNTTTTPTSTTGIASTSTAHDSTKDATELEAAASQIKMASENELKSDNELEASDDSTKGTDGSDSEGTAPIDDATDLNENGDQIHSKLSDNDFSILTVKDTEGKVISNQATADLKKFERFIKRMRQDIHHIAKMETAKTISKKKIAHNEAKTLDNTQVEQEKAALTKGQSKGTAASLGMSHHETEQPGFEIDSKQLNSTNDDKTVSTKAPISQPDDTRLRDTAQFERTTTTILSTVTVPITTRDSTTAAPTTTATTSTTVSATTTTTTTATSVNTTTTPISTTGIATVSTAHDSTKDETELKAAASQIKIASENELKNDNELKASDDTTKGTDVSDSEGTAPIDDATDLNENGDQIHSKLSDNDFSILTVKDAEGKVISNQATADLKKFERFIEKMRDDIDRIAKVEADHMAEKKGKAKTADDDIIVEASQDTQPENSSSKVFADEKYSEKQTHAVESSESSEPSAHNHLLMLNETKFKQDFKAADDAQIGDLSSHETNGLKIIKSIDKRRDENSEKPQNMELKSAGGENGTFNRTLFDVERTTNEDGKKVHSQIINASDFSIIPSTRKFKMDSYGNPLLPKDTKGRVVIENERGELPPPERLTNENGEVVHSDIIADDFTIIKVTDRQGNPLTEEELRGESKQSSEEDDFFVEPDEDTEGNISTTLKPDDLEIELTGSKKEGDINDEVNALKKEINVNITDVDVADTQKDERKQNNKKDEEGRKDKKDGKKHKNKKDKKKKGERKHKQKKDEGEQKENNNEIKLGHSETQNIGSKKIAEANVTTVPENDNHEGIVETDTKENVRSVSDKKEIDGKRKSDEANEHKKDRHEGKEEAKEKKKAVKHKKDKRKKHNKSKTHHINSVNDTEIDLRADNVTSLIDDLNVKETNSDQRNQTTGLKRLRDDPSSENEGGENSLYRLEGGNQPATAPPAPNFGDLKDDEIRAKARMLKANKKQSTLSGGRAGVRNFEETLADTVPYNDTDFS